MLGLKKVHKLANIRFRDRYLDFAAPQGDVMGAVALQ
jgi:hypothetical protein